MPTQKKRINLAVSEELYEKILSYKTKYGIVSDATACVQLITQQIAQMEETESMMSIVKKFSLEELQTIASIGFQAIKSEDSK